MTADLPPFGFYVLQNRKTKNPVWCRWCERKLIVVKQAFICEKCDVPAKVKGMLP